MIVKDDETTYHANPALSNSRISLLLKCPAAYKWSMDHPKEEDSDTLLLGRLFHAMVLEEETVADKYSLKKFNGSTREGKAEKKTAEEAGLTLVPKYIWDAATEMAAKVRWSQFWQTVLQDRDSLTTETSIYWNQGGIDCKARLDCITTMGNFGRVIIDLKSTQDSNPEAIKKSIATYGYHRQAAWYRHALALEGIPTEAFIFVFVEKQPPYNLTVAVISEAAQAAATEEIRTALDTFRQCQESNCWPDYTNGQVVEVDLPEWYYRQGGANV